MTTRRQNLKHDPPVPPPDRQRLFLLFVCIAAPPVIWSAQLLVLSALANHACFPADIPRPAPATNMSGLRSLEIAADAVALLIAAASAVAPVRYFQRAAERLGQTAARDRQTAWYWNRTCFLSLAGILSASGFGAAILFETIASLLVPPCS